MFIVFSKAGSKRQFVALNAPKLPIVPLPTGVGVPYIPYAPFYLTLLPSAPLPTPAITTTPPLTHLQISTSRGKTDKPRVPMTLSRLIHPLLDRPSTKTKEHLRHSKPTVLCPLTCFLNVLLTLRNPTVLPFLSKDPKFLKRALTHELPHLLNIQAPHLTQTTTNAKYRYK